MNIQANSDHDSEHQVPCYSPQMLDLLSSLTRALQDRTLSVLITTKPVFDVLGKQTAQISNASKQAAPLRNTALLISFYLAASAKDLLYEASKKCSVIRFQEIESKTLRHQWPVKKQPAFDNAKSVLKDVIDRNISDLGVAKAGVVNLGTQCVTIGTERFNSAWIDVTETWSSYCIGSPIKTWKTHLGGFSVEIQIRQTELADYSQKVLEFIGSVMPFVVQKVQ